MLSVVGKIYAGILVDRVRGVTGVLNDDEQGGFREERGYVAETFTLKQRPREKNTECMEDL